MAEKRPNKDFGKRRPRMPAALPLPPKEPVKRSGHVALLVMGTLAVGSTAFMLMPSQNCEPSSPGMAAQSSTTCSSRSSSSGSGGSSHWSSRSSYYSSDSSSHSSSGSSDSGSGGVTRGGFGSFAHGFSGGG